jgi:hypothetical protein
MLPSLIEQGRLRALSAVPPIFYQDGFFGTDAGRVVNARNATEHLPDPGAPRHFVYLPPCKELDAGNLSLVSSEGGGVIRGRVDDSFVDAAEQARRIELWGGAARLLQHGNVPVQGRLQDAYFSQHGTAIVVRAPLANGAAANGVAGIVYSQPARAAWSCGERALASWWRWGHERRASLDPGAFDVAVGAWRDRLAGMLARLASLASHACL